MKRLKTVPAIAEQMEADVHAAVRSYGIVNSEMEKARATAKRFAEAVPADFEKEATARRLDAELRVHYLAPYLHAIDPKSAAISAACEVGLLNRDIYQR